MSPLLDAKETCDAEYCEHDAACLAWLGLWLLGSDAAVLLVLFLQQQLVAVAGWLS
jgi:hypothetical protein